MDVEEIKRFITDDLGCKAKDIERFIQEANKQEFEVCRFFIGWAVASISALAVPYLKNFTVATPSGNYLLYLREGFPPLATSISLGILHHLSFHHKLLKESKGIDKTIRDRVTRIIEKGNSEDEIKRIKDEIIDEYKNKPAILIGFKGFLYAQMGSFLFAVLIVAYVLFSF